MTPMTLESAADPEVIFHPSGDLILPIILDPAVAAQVKGIAERWGNTRLSETVSDILLIGLISIQSRAGLS